MPSNERPGGEQSGALESALREWLPSQRWFAGKDSDIRAVSIVSQRELTDGEPRLLHLLADVHQGPASESAQEAGAPSDLPVARYQLMLGVRADLPSQLDHALVAHVDGIGFVYGAAYDQELMAAVLRWINDNSTREGIAFRREPHATIDVEAPSLVIGAEQSNTSVVYGDVSILKVFRLIVPGLNPDLELNRALTDIGNKHVAALHGWFEAEIDGVPTTLGLLQEFLRTGSDGWALALTSVRDLFAEADLHADEVGGDFAAESERLGIATADVHAALARALPTGLGDQRSAQSLATTMRERLDAAAGAIPALAQHAPAIRAAFDDVGRRREPFSLQRIHGDYHLGQVMRTENGWALLDFEGEPGAPIDKRSALSSPLRDIAGMLRSLDYASRYLLADYVGAANLEYRATEWADRNRDAFCIGYAKGSGRDPREDSALLRAFELDKAVYEVTYEARNRPDWVSIPLGSIERLLASRAA